MHVNGRTIQHPCLRLLQPPDSNAPSTLMNATGTIYICCSVVQDTGGCWFAHGCRIIWITDMYAWSKAKMWRSRRRRRQSNVLVSVRLVRQIQPKLYSRTVQCSRLLYIPSVHGSQLCMHIWSGPARSLPFDFLSSPFCSSWCSLQVY